MSGKTTSKWVFGHTDEGSYVSCSNCKRKISAKEIIFADSTYNKCPGCKKTMDSIDDEIIESLRISLL